VGRDVRPPLPGLAQLEGGGDIEKKLYNFSMVGRGEGMVGFHGRAQKHSEKACDQSLPFAGPVREETDLKGSVHLLIRREEEKGAPLLDHDTGPDPSPKEKREQSGLPLPRKVVFYKTEKGGFCRSSSDLERVRKKGKRMPSTVWLRKKGRCRRADVV